MASKQTYPCYVCKKNGFPDTRVYLDGKTEDGKTIYKNEDLTAHFHKQVQQQQTQQQEKQPTTTTTTLAERVRATAEEYDNINKQQSEQQHESQIVSLLKVISAQLELIANLLKNEKEEKKKDEEEKVKE